MLAAGTIDPAAFPAIAGRVVLQLGVGVAGRRALLWFIRRVGLPVEGLYPPRTPASVFVIYGVATLAHGSGLLAAFIAGIVLGDDCFYAVRSAPGRECAVAALFRLVTRTDDNEATPSIPIPTAGADRR